MRRTLILVGVVLGACAKAPQAPLVFGVTAGDGQHTGSLDLRADGRWTYATTGGGGWTDRGRLAEAALQRFRALLATATFQMHGPCSPDPYDSASTIGLADYARARYIHFIKGCRWIDDATARLADCLFALKRDPTDTAAC